MFDLLRDRQIRRRRVTSLLSRYQNPSGPFPPWWFDYEFARFPDLRFIPIVVRCANPITRLALIVIITFGGKGGGIDLRARRRENAAKQLLSVFQTQATLLAEHRSAPCGPISLEAP